MKKLTKEEKHKQCLKEIKATMLVVVVCFFVARAYSIFTEF